MAVTRADIERFFSTLILGDFEENQSASAQVVGGLISMIPILDQVMDARDITGSLFRINKQGGFAAATPDQLANLGFAAFGAVPFIGSVFKISFKPLWRQRHTAGGMVSGGREAVESQLRLEKGGAIRWIRMELLGKWSGRTAQAVLAVEAAMDSCIALLDFIADTAGWRDWRFPDALQDLARQALPGMRTMRGQIRAPLQRASNEIREFLEDLLGEQAAAVVMAAGGRAVAASAVPGTRSRSGRNAAALQPQGRVPERQPPRTVGGSASTQTRGGVGNVHSGVQRTRAAFAVLANQEKGLIGEHIVDYYELQRLGGAWPHDQSTGDFSPATVRKLNCDQRPVNLSLLDLPKVNQRGIDAVWQHSSRYTVTEAKARESVVAANGLGRALQSSGHVPRVAGLNPSEELLHFLLSDSGDKGGTVTPTMQMSREWVRDRARSENVSVPARSALTAGRCARRVVLVTFESDGVLDHVQALADIHLGRTGADVHPHPTHGISQQWEAAAIDRVAMARRAAHGTRGQGGQPRSSSGSSPPTSSRRPRRP